MPAKGAVARHFRFHRLWLVFEVANTGAREFRGQQGDRSLHRIDISRGVAPVDSQPRHPERIGRAIIEHDPAGRIGLLFGIKIDAV